MPNPESSPEQHRPGVRSHRIENNYYVVDVCWRDGQESEMHIPMNVFDVVDPETRLRIGKLKGEEALQILIDHAAETTREEFDWRNYIENHDVG